MFTYGSAFAGIGGIDKGMDDYGFLCKWQIENAEFPLKILSKHWPNVPKYGDIRKVDGNELPSVDVICGGFPCPAFSSAGKKGGFEQDDLFYDLLRLIKQIKPKIILFENVENFKRWRKELQNEIENIGYEWIDFILDARDFGIPQSRRRYFAIGIQRRMLLSSQYLWGIQGKESSGIHGIQPNYPYSQRWWTPTIKTKEEWRTIFSNSRRIRNAHGIPYRMDRIRGLGNAVPPQMAYFNASIIYQLLTALGA